MAENSILTREAAQKSLDVLIGQPLQWAIKSPDVELFDLGFGREGKDLPPYVVHAICTLKVIFQQGRDVRLYQGDASYARFQEEMNPLMGQTVRRVALSDKHDLWLDLGDCWMVFITFEDGEESWRFFQPHQSQRHLVATDKELELQ